MDIEERIFVVIVVVLIELLIILFLQFTLVSSPKSGTGVDLFVLMLDCLLWIALCILLIFVVGLVILKIDRVCNVVGILLDKALKGPTCSVGGVIIVQVKDDCSTLLISLGTLD